MLKPFGAGVQLFQTIRDVHGRSSGRRMQVVSAGALDPSRTPCVGKRVVVLGPKGGVGSTTVAVNLALLLRDPGQASVALLDADFLGGDSTLHLNRGRSYGTFKKSDVSREEVVQMMAGGQELEELTAELAEFARTDQVT